jgi:NAD dependent epimerase/dehydratase
VVDNFKGKSVLVTGADGFIGSHLVEALVGAGANVTALAQYNAFGANGWLDDLPQDVRSHLDIRRGDIRDPFFVHGLVDGQQIVFHLAALIAIPYSYDAPQAYVDVNVTGTVNMLEASRGAGVSRFVQTSTSEVYGTAQFTPITEAHPLHGQSPYAASKIAADMMAEAYACSFDLPVYILRPFNTYGPRQSERAVIPTVIRQALDPNCDAIRLGDLTPKRDFNYVGDTVGAFLRAGGAAEMDPGAPYNVGSGEAVSIGEMVGLVQNLCGVNKPVEHESARDRPANSEVYELIASAEKFNAASGWQTQIALEQGLAQTIEWWRERIRNSAVRRDSDYLS